MIKFAEKHCGKCCMNVDIEGYLIKTMNSLYNISRACVRLGSRMGEYFEVKKELRQGCVMSPWLFNIFFFDKVVRQVNERAMGKGLMRMGVRLGDEASIIC